MVQIKYFKNYKKNTIKMTQYQCPLHHILYSNMYKNHRCLDKIYCQFNLLYDTRCVTKKMY